MHNVAARCLLPVSFTYFQAFPGLLLVPLGFGMLPASGSVQTGWFTRILAWMQLRAASAGTLPAFAARFARFFGSKLMRSAFFMGRAAAFAGYFPLLFGVHPRKATLGGIPVRHQRFS
jgi:hypothetical protein